MKSLIWLFAFIGLVGCASNAPQVVIDPQTSELRVNIRARSVMVRDISLPDYAQASEISVQMADGTLVETRGRVWADDPARAMAGAMIRNLATITSAEVAAEPWPLSGYPDVELSIRVEHMYAQQDGSVTLAGYFAIRKDRGRGNVRQFDIVIPGDGRANLVPAYEAAWTRLAEQIAPYL